jgi:hypothetical protein
MNRTFAFVAFIIYTLVSASCKDLEYTFPLVTNHNQLGLVVLAPDSSASGLILLKDGRVIVPKTGFTPQRVSAGGKFLISFTLLSTAGKVSTVHVTGFQLAIDSTFAPAASDTAAVKAALQGTHKSLFTYASAAYSAPQDTSHVYRKDFSLAVTGNTFECSTTSPPVPGGNGVFFFQGTKRNDLNFVNSAFPGLPYLLTGNYYYALLDHYVVVWTYDNANYYEGYLIGR